METSEALRWMGERAAAALRPVVLREPRSHWRFASELQLPDGQGRRLGLTLDPASHPMMEFLIRELDKCLSDGRRRWSRVTIAKPGQDGGTLAATVSLLRETVDCGLAAAFAFPTEQLGERAWRTKVQPVLVSQGGVLPERGAGSEGGVPSVPIVFASGGSVVILTSGGRNESAQSSLTLDVIVRDEIDDWLTDAAVERTETRITESVEPLLWDISTVKRDRAEDSRILRYTAMGSRHRLEFRCPHCHRYHLPTWEGVHWEGDDEESIQATAAQVCPHCGGHWREAERQQALSDWVALGPDQRLVYCVDESGAVLSHRVVGPEPVGRHLSIEGWSLHVSPRRKLADTVEKYVRAQAALALGDPEPLRRWWRDVQTRCWAPDDQKPKRATRDWLARKSAQAVYERRELPDEVDLLTSHVDVQKRRLYWMLTGTAREDLRTWIIDSGMMPICLEGAEPGEKDYLLALNAIADRIEAGADSHKGRRMALALGGVDVAYNPKAVSVDEDPAAVSVIRRWANQRRRWVACRGRGASVHGGRQIAGQHVVPPVDGWYEYRRQVDGSCILFVDADHVKERALEGLQRDDTQPAAVILPRLEPVDGPLIRQLTAAELVRGRDGYVWQERRDNHHWDNLYNCLALARFAIRRAQAQQARRPGGVVGRVG